MTSRKRKASTTNGDGCSLSESLFGESSNNKSLSSSLFGNSDGDGDNGDNGNLFSADTSQRLNMAVSARTSANMSLLTRKDDDGCPKRNDKDASSNPPVVMKNDESRTVKEILDQRKRQGTLAKEMICSRFDDADVPHDVWVRETADVVRTNGFAIVRNALPSDLLESLAKLAVQKQDQAVMALEKKGVEWSQSRSEPFRYHEAASRCHGRMDLRLDSSTQKKDLSSFGEVLQNDTLKPIVDELLGANAAREESHLPELVYMGLILSYPGSDGQPWHQDGMPLFGEMDGSAHHFPPYAINIFIPLSDNDVGAAAGPTEFIPGSHVLKEQEVMHLANDDGKGKGIVGPLLEVGDALIYDYRVCHRGTSNLTHKDEIQGKDGRVRKILYLMYSRPWFKEHLNFGEELLFS